MILAPLGERQFHLGAAAPVEIHAERHEGHALARDGAMELVYLTFVKQQFTRALGFVIEAVAVAEFGDVGVDQPHLPVAHLGIAFADAALAEAQGFHLGAGERDPRLIDGIDAVFEPRLAVLGDDLLLVEGGGLGTRHWARCRECPGPREAGCDCPPHKPVVTPDLVRGPLRGEGGGKRPGPSPRG
ncbi:hypothetical protein WR25_04339 [Diploscapter pachys]|uniref:Uncharacterized protein n=1 Tax=Diploscapter pachys TaxID=2018661 RepID=A0A2A2JW94_9BILA|nr:hypothetical protein WR25_04339 [Diploscapter pachys]